MEVNSFHWDNVHNWKNLRLDCKFQLYIPSIDLLEKIVSDQRQILMNAFNRTDVTDIPQQWVLCRYQTFLWYFPELILSSDTDVLGYYDDGMRVPDDVTLLWADDKYVMFPYACNFS